MQRIMLSLMLLLVALRAQATDPATAPASQPSDASIALWFADLTSPDAAVREAARINLMGLRRAELPQLKSQAIRNMPLNAGQLSTLKQIVIHVFLAEQDEPAPENSGFMGVSFGYQDDDEAQAAGVVVNDRIPGFTAFRMLQNGDIIISVQAGDQRGDAGKRAEIPVRNRTELSAIVSSIPAGEVVKLRIIRGGRALLVPLRLNARPLWAANQNAEAQEERLLEAEKYWEDTFAQELDPSIG